LPTDDCGALLAAWAARRVVAVDNRQSGNRHSEIGNPLIFNRQSAIANRQGFDALN
jgi:hypothetical protein